MNNLKFLLFFILFANLKTYTKTCATNRMAPQTIPNTNYKGNKAVNIITQSDCNNCDKGHWTGTECWIKQH